MLPMADRKHERIQIIKPGKGHKPIVNEHNRVAIVIPCFRHAHFLRGAIESALAQTVAAAEIIVVDDGSPDDPGSVTRNYPQVRLVRQDNRGLAAARNAGLQAATSARIIFLDADDRLQPDAIAAGLECFADHPEAAFVYGAYRQVGLLRRADRFRLASTRCDLIRCNWVGMIGTVMFDRAKLLGIGGFDPSLGMCEDWDAYLRLSREFPFAAHRRVVARYLRHRSNMSNDKRKLRHWIDVVRQKELQRGLRGPGEEQAWREGVAVLADAYPPPLKRLANIARRLVRPGRGR